MGRLNKNYNRGVEKERELMKTLEAAGYNVMRTAGSHGTFDIIALGPTGVRFIQVKRGKEESSVIRDCNGAVESIRQLPQLPGVSYETWGWLDNHGWVVMEVII